MNGWDILTGGDAYSLNRTGLFSMFSAYDVPLSNGDYEACVNYAEGNSGNVTTILEAMDYYDYYRGKLIESKVL